MENRVINIAIVAEVAEALKELKEDMVFVGGAVISLYTDDPAADEVRPTQDVDMTLNIINFSHWQRVEGRLRELGFQPNPFGHAICSFKYKDILIDIMATEDGPLGLTNRWYKVGLENIWTVNAKNQKIKILSAPCYLATKLEAFNDRGNDYRSSHDIEDIIYVIDNRTTIVNEVKESDKRVYSYLKKELLKIVKQGILTEVLMTHIHPLMIDERMPIIEDKIMQILEL